MESDMTPTIATQEDWLKARETLLAAEKAFTRERDALSARRREMPWLRIEQDYVFTGPNGQASLSDLFAGRSQLIVYHLMFAPEWEWACKSCSFWADQFDGAIPHLNARDTSFVAISRAPLAKLQRHATRLGWKFPWLSAEGNSFAYDMGFTFAADAPSGVYNFKPKPPGPTDLPGFSMFIRGADGAIYKTYNIQGRGQDITNGAYNMLDFTALGRSEATRPTMQWVRLHDEYGG
jgi:predicted dithiol-disulfide oxidoreductase (DUF899 family)